MQNRCYY